MASRAIGAIVAFALLLGSIAWARPQIREQTGAFAFYGMQQRVVARLRRVGSNELVLVQSSMENREPITRYMSVAGAPVHFFLVRDDFQTLMHVHPQVQPDGRFAVHVSLDKNHRYYAFVDSFAQGGIGEQAFRFTLQSGSPPHHLATTLSKPNNVARAGPYNIALSTAYIRANVPVTISTTVMRGKSVLTPPNHESFKAVAALINTGSLNYASVYEGQDSGMQYPGEYGHPQLRLPALPPGFYRMWLQMTIAGKQVTASFMLAAQ